jgi:hypothetical protein
LIFLKFRELGEYQTHGLFLAILSLDNKNL